MLRCDIYRFFPAIDHEILKQDIRRRITCLRTLNLVDCTIDAPNPQEPVNIYFPGDEVFTPLGRRRGISTGNLTSQFLQTYILTALTTAAKKCCVRYVDEFALFYDERAQLEQWQLATSGYLERRRLLLYPRKTFIAATNEDAVFLGFILLSNGARRLPEENVRRFRRRLRRLRESCRNDRITCAEVEQRVAAWIAHAERAETSQSQ